MSLQSNLFTGVSGLQANSTRLSVIGNNIANINTVGFKAGRANFKEFLVQRIDSARSPIEGTQGGRNPIAYGLGVGVASIDNLFEQGTLESTGVTTDLAIDGDGMFVLRDGTTRVYTRAGGFQFDGNGNLVQNGTGFIVQGRLADKNGSIASGATITDIQVPLGLTTPAKASQNVVLKDNLNADSEVLPNILTVGEPFTVSDTGGPASGVTDINNLSETINSLDEGDRININGTNPDGELVTGTFRYGTGDEFLSDGSVVSRDGKTLGALVNKINNIFSGVTASINGDGEIVLVDDSAGASQTSISLSFEEDASEASVLGDPINDNFLAESVATITGSPLNIVDYDPDTLTGGFTFASDSDGTAFPRQLSLSVGGVDSGKSNVITIAPAPDGDDIYKNAAELVFAINSGINNDLELSGTVAASLRADGSIQFTTTSPSDYLVVDTVSNGDQSTVGDLGLTAGQEGTGVGAAGLDLTSLKSTSELRVQLAGDSIRTIALTPRVYTDIEDLVNGLNASINSNTALSGKLTAFVDFSQGAAAISFITSQPNAELNVLRGTQTVPLSGSDVFDLIGFNDAQELTGDGIPGNDSDYNNISTDGNATSSIGLPNFNQTQEGRDAGRHTASILVYDGFGETHNMVYSLQKSTQQLAAIENKLISTENGLTIASRDPNASAGATQPVDASIVDTALTSLVSTDDTDPNNPLEGDASPRADDLIRISGSDPQGTAVSTTVTIQGGTDPTTVRDLLDEINALYNSIAAGGDGTGATATINDNGQIILTDDISGASLTSLKLSFEDNPENPRASLPDFPFRMASDFRTLQTGQNEVTTDVPGQWDFDIRLTGNEDALTGNSGTITFNPDGSLQGFSFDDRSSNFGFDPNNGADRVELDLDFGTIGGFDGLTQFQGSSTAIISSQDGFAAGKLSGLEFDDVGTITGVFDNGVTQTLGKLVLANFNNPGGLSKEGNNNYAETANSGVAVVGEAGTNIQGTVRSGYLESSNVDLSQEFANMITTQRGFQANARVITSTDTLLGEVVNLAR